MLRLGKVFPKLEHTNWLCHTGWPVLKLQTCNIVDLAHMHVYITATEKEGHEFERKQGRVYRRVWREEMEGENRVIILQSHKSKKIIFKKFTLQNTLSRG